MPLFSLPASYWASSSAPHSLTTGGTVTKPAFSNPDKTPVAVTPGVTELERAAARRVRFNQPPDRTGPEWYDENSEEL